MSNERKHAELIKRWSENKDLKVEKRYEIPGAKWQHDTVPTWGDDIEYRLVEPDPYKHLKKAKLEGKTLQVFGSVFKWMNIDFEPSWDLPVEHYRIKPEPKYVPFTWEDRELLRGKTIVRVYNNGDIQEYTPNTFYLPFENQIPQCQEGSFECVFKNYTFLDGTPCGKLVKDESY